MNVYRSTSTMGWAGVMMALLTVVLSGSPDICAQTADPVDDAVAKPAHSCKVGSCNVTVRQIGRLTSAIADRVLAQVHAVAFFETNDSPILLQGETMSKLRPRHMRAIKATYQAGHTIVLLDPTMLHVKALHQLIGEGVRTVPPLIVSAGNIGNEGAAWKFTYCTTGQEPDGGDSCTSHVQTTSGCRNRLGDNSGTNPQSGQTPGDKFSNAVQSVHWEAGPDTRVGSTFDISVNFAADLATTTAHLSGPGRDPNQGCNDFNCACESETLITAQISSFVFEVPFPSTQCTQ